MQNASNMTELERWLEESYPQSVRTAFLLLGNRLDAEDAVQEAFLRAWKFRNSLSKEASIRPWLYRVVVNTCNSKLRKEIPLRDRHSRGDIDDELFAKDDASNRIAVSNDVISALKELPINLRVVVVLRYYADLSEREIAIAIRRQPGTVKSRLNEARRRLAQHPALRRNDSEEFVPDQEATL